MKPKQKINKIDWNNQFKIKPRRNASLKHETIKLLLVIALIERNKKNLSWIRLYTEHPIGEGKICDIYYENLKTNEMIAYEIQNNISSKWVEDTKEFYDTWDNLFFKTDWVLIKEKDYSEKIEEIYDKLKKEVI